MRVKAFLALIGAICVAVAIASAASGAVGPSPCQPGSGLPGQAGVTIAVPGSPLVFCPAGAIQAHLDVASTSEEVCGPLGKACHEINVASAISIKRLLHIAHIAGVQLAEIRPPDGAPSILNASLLQASPGNGGVIELNPAPTYVGPQGAGTTTLEEISASDGGSIELHAYTGQPLGVSVAASQGQASSGTRVQFTASPAGAHTYIWNSPDGRVVTGSNTLTLKVNDRGASSIFDVYVTVVGAGGAGASSTPAQVIVAAAPTKNQVNPSGGASPNGSTTPTTPTTTTPPYTAPTYNVPPASTTSPQQHHAPSRHPRTTTVPGFGQKVVQGRLISDVTPVSPAAVASGNGGAGATVSGRQSRPTSLVTRPLTVGAGIAAAAVIIVLLGFGAAQELRSLRRSIASARLA